MKKCSSEMHQYELTDPVWLQYGRGGLSRLKLCLKFIKLAFQILHGNFGLVYVHQVSNNGDEK